MKCVIFVFQSLESADDVSQSGPEHAAVNNTYRLILVSKISVNKSPCLYEFWRSASTTEIVIRASCILAFFVVLLSLSRQMTRTIIDVAYGPISFHRT